MSQMKKSQGWAALVAVVSMTATVLGAPAASAKVNSPDPRLTVTSVTLARTSVAVSGLNTVPVEVRMKGGYDSTEPGDATVPMNVFLERTGGTGPAKYMIAGLLKRVAGTVQKGEWAGYLYVPSTANGTFKVSGVLAGSVTDGSTGSTVEPTPYAGPSIAVTGLHLPKFSVSIIPKIVPFGSAYKVRVTVYDATTGMPYGTRINVQVTWDNLCVESDGDRYLTNTAGVVEVIYAAYKADGLNCVRLRGRAFDTLSLGWWVLRPGIVAATPSKTSAPVNSLVPVNGSVAGAPADCPVILQRLRGATQWRAVSQAKVRQSGRFTVVAQPPFVGSNIYRVALPTCGRTQAGVSKSFTIRGI
jgi:hypothetical protein